MLYNTEDVCVILADIRNILDKILKTVNKISGPSDTAKQIYSQYVAHCRVDCISKFGFDAFRGTQLSEKRVQDMLDGGLSEEEIRKNLWEQFELNDLP